MAALLLDPLLRIGVGERYAGAAGALGPALALLPLAALPLLAWQAASLRLRPGLAVWISGAAAVAFATVAVAAVPVWGAAGATVALLVSTAVAAATAALLMRDIVTPRLPGCRRSSCRRHPSRRGLVVIVSPFSARSFFRNPVDYVRRHANGNSAIRLGAGQARFILLRDPDEAWRVLVTDGASFRPGKWKRRMRRFVGETLNTLDGEAHRTRRLLLQPSVERRRVAGLRRRHRRSNRPG